MNIVGALLYKCPGKEFVIQGTDYSGLEWRDSSPKPTLEELQDAYAEYTALGIDPFIQEDWEGLREALVTSPLFQKCYMAAKNNQAVFMAFYKVEQVVLTTRIKEALEFFLNDLKNEMGSSITSEEITELNNLLKQKGFNFTIK
jgi:hypothetical protein